MHAKDITGERLAPRPLAIRFAPLLTTLVNRVFPPRATPFSPSPSSHYAGKAADVTVDVDATVDDARAAIAAALGHPGWFARVYYNGIGGELEGSTPLRESGYVEGDTCVVTAYTRPKPPPRPPHLPVSHTSPPRAPHAHVARRPMPASPGFRTRNYIRENEDDADDDGDEWEDVDADPLAAPVGRNARAPMHRHDVDDEEKGAEEGAEGHTAVSNSALAEEIWAELAAEARSASARALVEDAPPALTALEVSDDDGDTFAIAETPPE